MKILFVIVVLILCLAASSNIQKVREETLGLVNSTSEPRNCFDHVLIKAKEASTSVIVAFLSAIIFVSGKIALSNILDGNAQTQKNFTVMAVLFATISLLLAFMTCKNFFRQ